MPAIITKKQRGQDGEDLAALHLKAQGYKIVARNWRPGNSMRGEIDCIAWHGKVLCFVEVKTRASNDFGAPQEAVTRTKQKQISGLATAYVSSNKLRDTVFRFDVVEVWLPGGNEVPRLALHQNAFDYVSPGGRGGSRIF